MLYEKDGKGGVRQTFLGMLDEKVCRLELNEKTFDQIYDSDRGEMKARLRALEERLKWTNLVLFIVSAPIILIMIYAAATG